MRLVRHLHETNHKKIPSIRVITNTALPGKGLLFIDQQADMIVGNDKQSRKTAKKKCRTQKQDDALQAKLPQDCVMASVYSGCCNL